MVVSPLSYCLFFRENELMEMGIAIHDGGVRGVFSPKNVCIFKLFW